jgi:hypothetical protein
MNQYEPLARTGVRYVPALSTQGPEVLAVPVIAGQTSERRV